MCIVFQYKKLFISYMTFGKILKSRRTNISVNPQVHLNSELKVSRSCKWEAGRGALVIPFEHGAGITDT